MRITLDKLNKTTVQFFIKNVNDALIKNSADRFIDVVVKFIC